MKNQCSLPEGHVLNTLEKIYYYAPNLTFGLNGLIFHVVDYDLFMISLIVASVALGHWYCPRSSKVIQKHIDKLLQIKLKHNKVRQTTNSDHVYLGCYFVLHAAHDKLWYSLQEFDAFVSYSNADFKWVCEELVPRLENRQRPFRLCVHERDFLGGADVVANIIASIDSSRRTLIVLSNTYVQSEWCRFEFKQAHLKV